LVSITMTITSRTATTKACASMHIQIGDGRSRAIRRLRIASTFSSADIQRSTRSGKPTRKGNVSGVAYCRFQVRREVERKGNFGFESHNIRLRSLAFRPRVSGNKLCSKTPKPLSLRFGVLCL
jgi:hypothetical protein